MSVPICCKQFRFAVINCTYNNLFLSLCKNYIYSNRKANRITVLEAL